MATFEWNSLEKDGYGISHLTSQTSSESNTCIPSSNLLMHQKLSASMFRCVSRGKLAISKFSTSSSKEKKTHKTHTHSCSFTSRPNQHTCCRRSQQSVFSCRRPQLWCVTPIVCTDTMKPLDHQPANCILYSTHSSTHFLAPLPPTAGFPSQP